MRKMEMRQILAAPRERGANERVMIKCYRLIFSNQKWMHIETVKAEHPIRNCFASKKNDKFELDFSNWNPKRENEEN